MISKRATGKMVMNDYLSARSTIRTMASPEVPFSKSGADTFIAKVGDTVKSSAVGTYKAGTPIKIVKVYKQAGYCYYVDTAGVTHRNKDIVC